MFCETPKPPKNPDQLERVIIASLLPRPHKPVRPMHQGRPVVGLSPHEGCCTALHDPLVSTHSVTNRTRNPPISRHSGAKFFARAFRCESP
ncbi:hypothetical protein Bcep1808_1263 [Burkholderia vietnamiensis G4]|uniref:Uncharacterized protein n=1 Tax=Burkholderia vietnamiensis (strain G4 / LMG 22486) TaxID=269482 RepID=A4JDC0_BURVG|nr:hypothetical protein Bcep1808_1263 [Burkholderia vietnamiensis G4]